jgi:hypothetical protein
MSRSDNLRDVKERVPGRRALGLAFAILAGYLALAAAILRRPKK